MKTEFQNTGRARDINEIREEWSLIENNTPDYSGYDDYASLISFLRDATPEQLRAHNEKVLAAHEARKKYFRESYLRDRGRK